MGDFMNRVDALLQQVYHDDSINIEDLSQRLCLSYPHFYRKVKKESGLSPSRYLRRLRLEKAIDLMGFPNLTLSEIAYRVGFHTPNYFSQCFATEYGQTPSEYRKRLRADSNG